MNELFQLFYSESLSHVYVSGAVLLKKRILPIFVSVVSPCWLHTESVTMVTQTYKSIWTHVEMVKKAIITSSQILWFTGQRKSVFNVHIEFFKETVSVSKPKCGCKGTLFCCQRQGETVPLDMVSSFCQIFITTSV